MNYMTSEIMEEIKALPGKWCSFVLVVLSVAMCRLWRRKTSLGVYIVWFVNLSKVFGSSSWFGCMSWFLDELLHRFISVLFDHLNWIRGVKMRSRQWRWEETSRWLISSRSTIFQAKFQFLWSIQLKQRLYIVRCIGFSLFWSLE